jgi:hypothetical protein
MYVSVVGQVFDPEQRFSNTQLYCSLFLRPCGGPPSPVSFLFVQVSAFILSSQLYL